jgi:hypothetical protein
VPDAFVLKIAKTLGKREEGRGKTLKQITRKCSDASHVVTIVLIRLLPIVAPCERSEHRRVDAADLRA